MITLKAYFRNLTVILLTTLLWACSDGKMDAVKELAGNNWPELQKVLDYYKNGNDEQKYKAAQFLISNMLYDKYSYEGDIISKYDTILYMYQALRADSIYTGDPENIKQVWDSLEKKHGKINPSTLTKVYDCQTLSAAFLIRNIEAAFKAWRNSPLYNPEEFENFCEYILPYRAGNEKVEQYRHRYYARHSLIADTSTSVKNLLKGFHAEFTKKQKYASSNLLWNYPIDLSSKQMEIARRGNCEKLCIQYAQILRSCGLPVTIDRAIWANRSIGHTWHCLLLDKNRFFPFDAFDKDSMMLTYKAAKIFRKTYSMRKEPDLKQKATDLPAELLKNNEIDITDLYVKTANITVELTEGKKMNHPQQYAVICVFDNKDWRAVHYGKILDNKVTFTKMATGVAYIAAYYQNSNYIPATKPFILDSLGNVKFCIANKKELQTLNLSRKYPLLSRIKRHAHMGILNAVIEISDKANFCNSTTLFQVQKISCTPTDSVINKQYKFRYIRFYSPVKKLGNLAEISFYHKNKADKAESTLFGTIIGSPCIDTLNEHPYTHAMDGDLETWFEKSRDSTGWVGLDLGKRKSIHITRISYCPRSDTNFIIKGDKYELHYWNEKWISAGIKTARDTIVTFDKIPSGTLYWLHSHSRGTEERIFTYENGKQVWW